MAGRSSTIYVYLLNEGTDVWRPVEAEHVGEDRYKIVSVNADPEDESWQFQGGAIVRCRQQRLSGGECLVAYELVCHPL